MLHFVAENPKDRVMSTFESDCICKRVSHCHPCDQEDKLKEKGRTTTRNGRRNVEPCIVKRKERKLFRFHRTHFDKSSCFLVAFVVAFGCVVTAVDCSLFQEGYSDSLSAFTFNLYSSVMSSLVNIRSIMSTCVVQSLAD